MIETTKAGYLEQGPFTEAGEGRDLLEALVRQAGPDPRAIAVAIRGLDIHVFWRGAYGVPEAPEIDPSLDLWALFGADGTPLLLTDNRSSTFFKALNRWLRDPTAGSWSSATAAMR